MRAYDNQFNFLKKYYTKNELIHMVIKLEHKLHGHLNWGEDE